MLRRAPPGGASTVSFGNEEGPLSPGKSPLSPGKAAAPAPAAAAPAPAAPEPVAEAPVAQEPVVEEPSGPSVEALKLQAIGAIAAAKDEATVKDALIDLIKKLQIAAAFQSEAQPGEPVSKSAPAAASEVPSSGYPALDAMRAALKLRGTHGIITIGKKFRSMDDNGDNKICYDEFKKAVIEMKLQLSEADMTKLFRHFDSDANGTISFNELLVGLRGQLNERRQDMVNRAFKVLDKNGDGTVTLADLEGRYDATRHPDVVAGNKTHRQVLMEFMEVFEQGGGGVAGDGAVTLQEFSNYYAMVSASVDDDDYFELMIRNVWHISGGEGWCANTTCKRLLVTHTDGSQTVEEVKDDFDVDLKDIEGLKKILTEQGVENIKSISLYGNMADGESISTPAAPTSTPGGPSTSSGATAPSPSTGRGKSAQMRSSIVFG